MVSYLLEGEAREHALAAVNDDSLVNGLRGEAVFHSTNDLELVLVDLADVSDGRVGEGRVFILVFFNEGVHHFAKLVLVVVEQVHLVLGLASKHVELHHSGQILSPFNHLFANAHELEHRMVGPDLDGEFGVGNTFT